MNKENKQNKMRRNKILKLIISSIVLHCKDDKQLPLSFLSLFHTKSTKAGHATKREMRNKQERMKLKEIKKKRMIQKKKKGIHLLQHCICPKQCLLKILFRHGMFDKLGVVLLHMSI